MSDDGWEKYWKLVSASADTKNLIKVEGLELKTADHIDLWYQWLRECAFNHGACISPCTTIRKNNIMGSKWADKII